MSVWILFEHAGSVRVHRHRVFVIAGGGTPGGGRAACASDLPPWRGGTGRRSQHHATGTDHCAHLSAAGMAVALIPQWVIHRSILTADSSGYARHGIRDVFVFSAIVSPAHLSQQSSDVSRAAVDCSHPLDSLKMNTCQMRRRCHQWGGARASTPQEMATDVVRASQSPC